MAQTVEDALLVRMEASLRKFERQMEGGRKAAVRAANGSERAWKRSGAQITANANRAATGVNRMMGSMSGGNRFVIQNTANQIGDMAIQLESGANGFRVMGQQIPQVLGGFAAMGGALGVLGPLLGTVAALGFPLAGMYFAMGQDAEEAADKTRTFTDRLSDAEGAIKNAAAAAQLASEQGLDDLGEMFGEISEEVRELALELFKIEERAARLKLGRILDEVSESIDKAVGSVGAVDQALAQVGTEEAREQIARLREDIESIEQRQRAGLFVDQAEIALLGQMREELAALQGDMANLGSLAEQVKLPPDLLASLSEAQAKFNEANEAADFSAVAEQLATIRDAMQQMGDVFDQDVVDSVTRAEEQARLMAKAMEDGKEAAEGIETADMEGAISGAASESVKLSRALGVSLDAARKIAALGPQGLPEEEEVGRSNARDPREMGGSFFDIRNREGTEFLDNYTPPRSSRRGGASSPEQPGLFDNAETQLTNLERQLEMIGKTSAEVAALTAKYKLLDEAKKRNIDLDAKQAETGETVRQQIERQSEAIGGLTEKYEQARERAAFFDQQMQRAKDGMLDAIVEGENLAGVLGNVAKAFAKAALEAALFGSGPMAGGGSGGGLLGGILGSIFPNANGNAFSGGRVTPFASGGIVNAPTMFPMRTGAGLMGEAGPEAVMPLTRIGGKLGVRAEGGGTQVSVPIQVNINKGAERDGLERRRGPDGQQIIDVGVSDSISSGRQDGVLGSRFGAQTQKVRR